MSTAYRSNLNPQFRSKFSEDIFNHKYRHEGAETWAALSKTLVEDVVKPIHNVKDDLDQLIKYIEDMKFIPGGRYLYYAGRDNKFFNNCFLLKAETDTREDWADLSWKAESCLMTGGGIGVDYSVYRGEGTPIQRTGGQASGPIPKMQMINEIGRRVMQGGSRRSAIYASLNWKHSDIEAFLKAKDWHSMPVGSTGYTVWDIKQQDFNFHAPLDMTNISVNYDTEWLLNYYKTGDIGSVFRENVRQALTGAEPGFSFNFFDKENETLRNAPVAADTYVLTNTGYQRVGDIVDESVTVWTGTQWATTRFTKTKSNVPTVTVTMTGGRTITCDPEHEFFVEEYSGRGSRRKLEDIYKVAAEDLEEGDIIHVSLPKEPSLVKRMSYRDYMLGYVYGDGSFNKSYPNRAEITYCTEESKGCASYIYKCKPDVQKFTVLNADGRGYTRHYLVDDIFKGRCKERLSYTDLDNVHIPSLIAGLFDADGNYDATQQRVRLSSVHLTFLQDVRRALETIGIESDVSKNGWCTYGDKQTYQLTIRKAYLDYFAAIIPTVRLNVPRGMTSYRPSMTKVISVTPNINQDVYCCDVKVPEHSFCAEGVIISNCTEVTSEDDSDVCNLGSINLGRIKDVQEFKDVVRLSTLFLICGTLRADLPYDKIKEVRAKNRRLGLGLMGMHEWLIQRGYRYEVTNELHQWLSVYKGESDRASKYYADLLYVSKPVANRAIAPTGSIGILAGTSTGIEPIFAVAYKRRYLKGGNRWHYQYVVDSAAQELISRYGIDPDDVESALDLAGDYERRIKFQADVQDYVDMSISSTINLPPRGDKLNNPDKDEDFAQTLAKYAHRLRGFTCYPDGSRGGQPLTSVPYKEAVDKLGEEFEEHVITHDICDISGSGGTCGV